MLRISDFKTDRAGDIILSSDDIQLEEDMFRSVLSVASKRICGRFDDNTYRENLCAGLERFLFNSNIDNAIYDIKIAIIECLTRDNLFLSSDYDIKIGNSSNPRGAKLYIVFKSSAITAGNEFKIFVDIENQRIFSSY